MKPHVAVLDPGTRVPELDSFNRMVLHSPVHLTYHQPAMRGIDTLRRGESSLLGVVILGSGASVYDDVPWQHALAAWLKPRLEAGLPALGLCYGHQLLAHLCGGEVGFLYKDREKLKGLRNVDLHTNRLWGDAASVPMIVSHREVVTQCPPGFEVVGTSDAVSIEAIAHTRHPQWGLQPHPEATLEFVTSNAVPYDGEESVLAAAHNVVDQFLALLGR